MSTAITYKIGGTYDNKGEKSAISGIKKIANAVSAFNKLAVVGIAVKALKKVNETVKQTQETFMQQNRALVNYNKALSNNANLTEKSIKDLNKTMSKLSYHNFFDDDTLNNAAALASNMGLTGDQIEKVMTASLDLASSGVMPLDSAVKNLSKTFTGTAGELGEMNGKIKSLTTEQLKNGEAVKVISEQYKGYAEAMSNTFSGRDTQYKNNLKDLQASLGGITTAFRYVSLEKINPVLEKITKFIEDNRKQIIKTFMDLPAILKELAITAGKLFLDLFSIDGITGQIRLAFDFTWELTKALFTAIIPLIKNLGNVFNAIFKWIEQNGMVNFIKALMNKLIEGINKVISLIPEDILNFFGIKDANNAITFRFETTASSDLGETISKAWQSGLGEVTSGLDKACKNFIKGSAEALKDFTDIFDETIKEGGKKISAIVNEPLRDDVNNNLDGMVNAGSSSSSSTALATTNTANTTEVSGTENVNTATSAINSLLSSLGQLGTVIQLLMSNNLIGLIIQVIISLISSVSEQSEAFSNALNVISTFTDAIATVIVPIIDEIFTPFVDIITSLGQIVGVLLLPILELISAIITPILSAVSQIVAMISNLLTALSPLFSLITEFMSLFSILSPVLEIVMGVVRALINIFVVLYNNVVVPIFNAINYVFTLIYNGFVKFVNGILGIIDAIPFVDVGRVAERSYEDTKLNAISVDTSVASASSSSASSAASGSASYTASKDVYVTINFNSSYVNGDAQDIAVMLAREIKTAEKMNLI